MLMGAVTAVKGPVKPALQLFPVESQQLVDVLTGQSESTQSYDIKFRFGAAETATHRTDTTQRK